MKNFPSKFILTRKPKEYLKQGLTHCGVYSLKAILSSYGKDNKKHPKKYHTNWFARRFFSFVWGKNYYDKIFNSYGIKSETKSVESLSNDQEKLTIIKSILSKNTPVMIRIGNGFIWSNRYNPILGRIITHWVTLWGYDDEKELFYVYDSGLSKQYWNKDLPIGNTTRTYKEILRDWKFGRWQPLCWNNSREDYLYVEVSSHS